VYGRLYETCKWDQRVVRRLVLEGRLAPRTKGEEDSVDISQECPICFLVRAGMYIRMHVARACSKVIVADVDDRVRMRLHMSECTHTDISRVLSTIGT
jgi:hypothetical protein